VGRCLGRRCDPDFSSVSDRSIDTWVEYHKVVMRPDDTADLCRIVAVLSKDARDVVVNLDTVADLFLLVDHHFGTVLPILPDTQIEQQMIILAGLFWVAVLDQEAVAWCLERIEPGYGRCHEQARGHIGDHGCGINDGDIDRVLRRRNVEVGRCRCYYTRHGRCADYIS